MLVVRSEKNHQMVLLSQINFSQTFIPIAAHFSVYDFMFSFIEKTEAFPGKISQIPCHCLRLSHYLHSFFFSPKFPTPDPSGFLMPSFLPRWRLLAIISLLLSPFHCLKTQITSIPK